MIVGVSLESHVFLHVLFRSVAALLPNVFPSVYQASSSAVMISVKKVFLLFKISHLPDFLDRVVWCWSVFFARVRFRGSLSSLLLLICHFVSFVREPLLMLSTSIL